MTQSRNLSGCQIFSAAELPADWACVTLKERIELAYGRGLREEERRPGDIDVYGSNGKVGQHDVALVNGPGILIGRKGTVGAVHFARRPFWPIDTVYYVVPSAGDDLHFLYHLLDYLPLDVLNAATGVPGLSRRDGYALRGAFPRPKEQAAIARVLDAVDTALDQTRTAVERSQTLQASVLTDAFHRMKVQRKRLGDFTIDVRYGTSKAANDRAWGYPTLRIPNVIGDHLSLEDVTFVQLRTSDIHRLTLMDGDLLLVRTNGNPNYVGRSAVFRNPDDQTWVYASYLIRVRLRDGLLPDYVNIFLGMERGRRELLRRVTTSAGNHNINSNSIRLISIPIPGSLDEQERIIEIAGRCRAYVAALEGKMATLTALKRSIRHDLLTGRMRLKPCR
jgi:type I restriction enzyme, S subunit